MLLAMLGVAAVLAAREASAARPSSAALAVKASTAFVAPFALLGAGTRRRPRFLDIGAALVGASAAMVAVAYLGLRLALARRDRPRRREPEPHQPPQHPDHRRPAHRPRATDATQRRRARPLRRPRRLPARLDLARRRLGPRRGLGLLRPPPRHLLAPPLVPDLGPPPRRPLPRPHPPAPGPRPDRLPTRSPHPAVSRLTARDARLTPPTESRERGAPASGAGCLLLRRRHAGPRWGSPSPPACRAR